MLAGRVRRGRGHHRQPCSRAHIEHAAPAPFHHRRHQECGQLGDGDHVGVQYLAGAGPVRGVEQRLVAEASVVDQDVHGADLLTQRGHAPIHVALVGQVDGESHHLQPWVRCHQLGPQSFEQPGPAGHNDQGPRPGRKLSGELTTDARRSTGYQHSAAIYWRTYCHDRGPSPGS